jgi:LuxR family transcriptional regulator, maltose regulon positive regulatory protein
VQARAYCAMLCGDRGRARDLLAQSILMGKRNNAWAYARGTVPLFDWMVKEALEAGIEVAYIQKYVRKFAVPPLGEELPNWPWPVKVFTLGEFRVEVDGEPLGFSRKTPKKPISLLKAIISFGGKNVPQQKLLDALWPDDSGDAAHESFAVSLHRLRKLLVHADLIQLSDGLVSLDAEKCWVDVWALERRISEADAHSQAEHATESGRFRCVSACAASF